MSDILGTIETEQAIPAKLLIGDKEIDVMLVSHSYKETQHIRHNGWITRLDNITVEETFTCVREFSRPIRQEDVGL